MQNISFTSTIRPVSFRTFTKETADIYNNVSEWYIEGTKRGASVKTDRIMDCTALGLTDGENALLMHIIPDLSSNKSYFPKIIDKIKTSIDVTSRYIQGILIGSKNYSRESLIGYNNFARFLKENKIPFSELKGGDTVHEIGYHSTKDEWLVSNFDIDSLIRSGEKNPMKLLQFGFDKVKINKFDDVV